MVCWPILLWIVLVTLGGENPDINWIAFDPRRYTWLLAGAALADIVHLAKDGYGLVEMLAGKG